VRRGLVMHPPVAEWHVVFVASRLQSMCWRPEQARSRGLCAWGVMRGLGTNALGRMPQDFEGGQ
jgi:hypothetical protein